LAHSDRDTRSLRTHDFDYDLPDELIAQTPLPRGQSRLLVLHRQTGEIEHRRISDILEYLHEGDVLVLNDSRVSARRVRAWVDGREGETLLVRPIDERAWEALVRPGKRFAIGASVELEGPQERRLQARVIGVTPDGNRIIEFGSNAARDSLRHAGIAPLPPYIKTKLSDEDRYQTVYATNEGSAAAPTAGLHFTDELLVAAQEKGVELVRVTLHIGIDTFRPVRVDSIEDHAMHGEWISIGESQARAINSRRGRLISVGTTTVRAIESAAGEDGIVKSAEGDTRLFIWPGYRFRAVDGILTNFHLPKSTLLMMISAFAGRERVLGAYEIAIRERYRFYSFGDAMLIV
jgi:S-adenosylmethionine:tRNA ribosyltransferase-isomerase